MMSSSLASYQRPNKRMAFSSRFEHMYPRDTASSTEELWSVSIDGPVKMEYLGVPQPNYSIESTSQGGKTESKQIAQPSATSSSSPMRTYINSAQQHSTRAASERPRSDMNQVSGTTCSVPIQPRTEPPANRHLSHPSPSLHTRTGVRIKACRGSKATEQKLEPTWKGFIGSTYEALQLLEGCLSGKLRHMPRRAYDREREEVIRSGHVFIFEENTSGIKRWTDGIAWSPSRLLPNFLIYREVEAKDHQPGEKKRAIKKRKRSEDETQGDLDDGYADPIAPILNPNDLALSIPEPERRRLCGSLTDSYNFKSDGLVKKTISVEYRGNVHHIIAYYNLEDVIYGRLPRMQDDAKLRELTPRFELLNFHKFQGNPDNPLDDPIRFCNSMRQSEVQHQWLAPSQTQNPPVFYPQVHQQTHQSSGYWASPSPSQWTQQAPMIQTFTPLGGNSQYCAPRTDGDAQAPVASLPYAGPYMNHYQPEFGEVYGDTYIPT